MNRFLSSLSDLEVSQILPISFPVIFLRTSWRIWRGSRRVSQDAIRGYFRFLRRPSDDILFHPPGCLGRMVFDCQSSWGFFGKKHVLYAYIYVNFYYWFSNATICCYPFILQSLFFVWWQTCYKNVPRFISSIWIKLKLLQRLAINSICSIYVNLFKLFNIKQKLLESKLRF